MRGDLYVPYSKRVPLQSVEQLQNLFAHLAAKNPWTLSIELRPIRPVISRVINHSSVASPFTIFAGVYDDDEFIDWRLRFGTQ